MTNIIKIEPRAIGAAAVQTCNARDLHAFLGNGIRFNDWIKKRISDYGFQEGTDFVKMELPASQRLSGSINHAEDIAQKNVALESTGCVDFGQQGRIEYAITLDMAKELAMVERNEKGKQARRYFIECERIAKGGAAHSGKPALRQIAPEFRAALSIAKTAGLKGNQAVLAADKAVQKVAGVHPLALIDATHLVADVQVRHYTPTELGKEYGESAQAFNRRLAEAGLQIRNEAGDWVPTPRGAVHSVLLDTGKAHSSGVPIQQLRWRESVLEVLTAPVEVLA